MSIPTMKRALEILDRTPTRDSYEARCVLRRCIKDLEEHKRLLEDSDVRDYIDPDTGEPFEPAMPKQTEKQTPVAWLEYGDWGDLFVSRERKGSFPVYSAPTKQEIGQEPFAWVKQDVCEGQFMPSTMQPRKIWWECENNIGFPIYTAPQKYCPLENNAAYEKGFVEGMAKQMHSSVDRAVNAQPKREWVGLTDNEIKKVFEADCSRPNCPEWVVEFSKKIEAKLKEKNT